MLLLVLLLLHIELLHGLLLLQYALLLWLAGCHPSPGRSRPGPFINSPCWRVCGDRLLDRLLDRRPRYLEAKQKLQPLGNFTFQPHTCWWCCHNRLLLVLLLYVMLLLLRLHIELLLWPACCH
jgi:hypothetical protein